MSSRVAKESLVTGGSPLPVRHQFWRDVHNHLKESVLICIIRGVSTTLSTNCAVGSSTVFSIP